LCRLAMLEAGAALARGACFFRARCLQCMRKTLADIGVVFAPCGACWYRTCRRHAGIVCRHAA